MIFSELYSAYYNAVAAILREAAERQLTKAELRELIAKHAFSESALTIYPALTEGRWQLLDEDLRSVLHHAPTMPLTTLQKEWLKAIAADPRIRLFDCDMPDFPEVEPLFRPEDVCVFDKYQDGDPFEDEEYIRHFRLILEALKKGWPLEIVMRNRKGNPVTLRILPRELEYSEKDDKFRLVGSGDRQGNTVNLGRIISVEHYFGDHVFEHYGDDRPKPNRVVFELTDRRNALERVLLHFAHFEKQVEKTGERLYRVTLMYDRSDETEIVIRILSFGPMVKVLEPYYFVRLIKERLIKQKSCGL